MKSKIEKKHESLDEKVLGEIDKYGIGFVKLEEIGEYSDLGETAILELPNGVKIGIVMKYELSNAILDPSANDIDLLKSARDRVRDFLRAGKIKEAPLERTLNDTYISSLIMNIIKYPKDESNEEILRQLGFYNEEIKKKYEQLASIWLGSPASLDSSPTSNIEKVTYSGSTDTIDLSSDICHEGSHYKLNVKAREMQERVNKETIISKEYLSLENEIVEFVRENAIDEKVKNNARNLVRMLLNLFCLYDKEKPLPIK